MNPVTGTESYTTRLELQLRSCVAHQGGVSIIQDGPAYDRATAFIRKVLKLSV